MIANHQESSSVCQGQNSPKSMELDLLFSKKQSLFVLSSARARWEFCLRYKHLSSIDFSPLLSADNADALHAIAMDKGYFSLFDFSRYAHPHDGILPSVLTIKEFFNKVTYTIKAKIPKNIREFFLAKALKAVKQKKKFSDKQNKSFLSPQNSFLSYLDSSKMLLQFYDELIEHKLPITAENLKQFSKIDYHDEYEWQLVLLGEIYARYRQTLDINELTDNIYSNEIEENYEILESYVKEFECIHLELEGFISPLQYEILDKVAEITPLCIHFRTDRYNISHLQPYFKNIGKDLEKDRIYIYSLSNGILLSKLDERPTKPNAKLYKTKKAFNQSNIALYLAHKWQQEILEGNASEMDFAVVLPNESFMNTLKILDSKQVFNFAMGLSIQSLESYQRLSSIYEEFQDKAGDGLNIKPVIDFVLQKKSNTEDYTENQKSLEIALKGLLIGARISENAEKLPLLEGDSLSKFLDILSKQVNQTSEIYLQNPNLSHLEWIMQILFYEYGGILAAGLDLLVSLVSLSNPRYLGGGELGFSELFALFMRGFSNATVDHTGGGKIRVMGALEARNLHFKEVLILDFTDDCVPSVRVHEMFLNSNIRRFYGMPTKLDKENLFKHHYYNLMRNSGITHLSFVNNRERVPSNMIFELGYDIDEVCDLDSTYSYYDTSLSLMDDYKEDDFGEFVYEGALSASALDTYRICSRKFYFKYVEKLSCETPLLIHGINHSDLGRCIHGILKDSYEKFLHKDIRPEDIDDIQASFEEECDRIINDNSLPFNINTRIEIDRLRLSTRGFFCHEKQRAKEAPIHILGLEYGFKANYKERDFDGTLDRIEIHKDSIWVFDYKTGKKPNKQEGFQMPLYSLCLEAARDNLEILKDAKSLPMKFAYIYLGHSVNFNSNQYDFLDTQDSSFLRSKQNEILEALKSLGKTSNKTSQVKNCDNCGYKVLCNR